MITLMIYRETKTIKYIEYTIIVIFSLYNLNLILKILQRFRSTGILECERSKISFEYIVILFFINVNKFMFFSQIPAKPVNN